MRKLVVIVLVVLVLGALAFIVGCMSLKNTPHPQPTVTVPVQIKNPIVAPKEAPKEEEDDVPPQTALAKSKPKYTHVEFSGVRISLPSERKGKQTAK